MHRDTRVTELQTSSPFVQSTDQPGASTPRLQPRSSLEALSLRVLELLEGLNEREAESTQSHTNSLEDRLLQFEQKLKNSNTTDSDSLLSEFRDLKSVVRQGQGKRVNSSLLGELVETVQVLLRESSPKHSSSSFPSSPCGNLLELINHIQSQLKSDTSEEIESMLQTLWREIKVLLDKTHGLEEDKNALVQLVSSGQELLAEMVKENESLEQQLTHQVTSRGLTILPNTTSENYSNGDQNGAYTEKELLNALCKEKAKSEYFEHQSRTLEEQANEAQKELELIKGEKQDLMRALDHASWIEDRNQLLQSLEEEKEKVSTWHEEIEDLEGQLRNSQEIIKDLKQQKQELLRAVDETSWAQDRQELLKSVTCHQQELAELTEELKERTLRKQDLQNVNKSLHKELESLKQKLEGDLGWKKQELSFKLDIAEKQNRILELTSSLNLTQDSLRTQEQCLTECQTELESLRQQIQEVHWADEKQQLLQALEEEIEKRSSWEEDQTTLENQITTLTEELANLRAENSSLEASMDQISWIKEKQELCEALEEEKEKLSSWREEMEALEEENRELKRVFHDSKDRDLIIQHKDEALDAKTAQIQALEAKITVQRDEICALSSTLDNPDNPEDWIKEKVEFIKKVGNLELENGALQERLKQESSKQQFLLIRIEELEIELDRVQRDLTVLKSSNSTKKGKHVSWGETQILEQEEGLDVPLPALSINIKNSHSKFGDDGLEVPKSTDGSESTSDLHCDLYVRVPHQRSRSIPATIQL